MLGRSTHRIFNRCFSSALGKQRVVVFDTTLRDGEQSPGASLNTKEKVIIAKQLSRLGVDVCEAGFPIASPGDFEAVKAIADEVGHNMEEREKIGAPMTIAGLSRATEKDIHRCYEAIKSAPKHRIHTFLATSDIHLEYKLKISREQCIENSVRAVKYARSLVEDVEFSAEDAGRSDPAFMAELFAEIIKAGASTINIPDTVGFTTPEDYGALIKYLVDNTPNSDQVIWSTHCHNDLGLATANSLAGVTNGARQVEVTINGIGERAGNTSLEEVVMTLNTRPNNYPVYTSINAKHITQTSRMVSRYTGMMVQPNKAIVGENAFAHEAGIHQDGVLKHAATYEIMTPESVGLTSTLVMGKHSGRNAFKDRLQHLGFGELVEDKEKLNLLFDKFKVLADKKKLIEDADLEVLAAAELSQAEELWKLGGVNVSGGASIPTATISLTSPEGEELTDAAIGAGPVEAIYKAIARVIGVDIKLAGYSVKAVTSGRDALGEVSVKIVDLEDKGLQEEGEEEGELEMEEYDNVAITYGGHSADVDTMKASAQAFVSAVNQMLAAKKMRARRKLSPPGRVIIH